MSGELTFKTKSLTVTLTTAQQVRLAQLMTIEGLDYVSALTVVSMEEPK